LKIPVQLRSQLILDSSNESWLAVLAQDFRVVFSTNSFVEGKAKLEQIPQLYGLMTRSKNITSDQIAEIKSMGKTVFLFEMRSSKTQRAVMKKAPTAILADDPRGALIIRD
jgi:hypothetical protein